VFDDLSVIERQQEKLTKETAPALCDPKCRSCPVVGYCWGGCSVIENTAQPLSKYCNQKDLIDRVQLFASSGTLIPTTQLEVTKHDNDII
jgi:sulfatase maturation enzyme AslB (radical SAM superfamily)